MGVEEKELALSSSSTGPGIILNLATSPALTEFFEYSILTLKTTYMLGL